MPVGLRPLLDIAGARCSQAGSDEHGNLHLRFSTGHQIDVAGDGQLAAWDLYGKNHGYMACLTHGGVHFIRHDACTTRGDVALSGQ
ncbi:hypothetical protein BST37_17140 [Mycobacterium noviomagense]|uniref:Uncharacterized protein n=1 Tax=Mycobacterium noviomagense TaxID=459858 RepID=A0ABX3T456_9MYCO|nr:hypothetical protein BST37_17140 [Mycobacterium noviomagense]